jgi:pyoverdine/dityrosine biosynthesis protein Dit1
MAATYSEVFNVGAQKVSTFKARLAKMEAKFSKSEVEAVIFKAVADKKFHQWGNGEFDRLIRLFDIILLAPTKKARLEMYTLVVCGNVA